ncbi:MAG: hypothetical protein AB8G14_13975 [Ilumatobacter sp.]
MGGGHQSGATSLLATVLASVLGVASLVAVTPLPVEALGTTFEVDSPADDVDAEVGDGVCNTAVFGAPAACTLRAAMQEAEAQPGRDVIEFALAGAGPHRIDVASSLPTVKDPDGVTIDGYSQAGALENTLDHGTNAQLMVELRGDGPQSFDAFEIWSAGSIIRGLSIFDFARHIRVLGPTANENQIIGNFIGTDAAATFRQPARITNSNGVHLERGAQRNRIGRLGNGNRNLFAGNADKGVAIYNAGTDENRVQNNVFGLTPAGDARLANWGHNIDINFSASNNLIGGTVAGEGNVVSGSELSGIEISHDVGLTGTTGNIVSHNLIGTTPDGRSGPLFAGNREFGVNLEGQARCADECEPDIADNSVLRNVIVGSTVNVMLWKGAHDNRVAFNNIGVLGNGGRAEGSAATTWAILIQAGAFDNLVERNIIAGVDRGIHVKPDNSYPSDCFTSDVTCPDDAVFDTSGNTFSKNSIDDIDLGLGIDLYEYTAPGPVVSGPSLQPSLLVNGGITMPAVLSVNSDELTATACAGCSIEVFVTTVPDCTLCWPDFGRGRAWVADGLADSNGDVRISLRTASTDRYVVAPGMYVAIHATDAAGNTSEHSPRVLVGAGLFAAPDDRSVQTIEVGVGPGPVVDLRTITLANVIEAAARCMFSVFC